MNDAFCSFLAIVGILIISFISLEIGANIGYRDGQIDAINGKIKYTLTVHPDKTTTWERKDNK